MNQCATLINNIVPDFYVFNSYPNKFYGKHEPVILHYILHYNVPITRIACKIQIIHIIQIS